MAEEKEETTAETPVATEKKGGKKLLLIIGGVVILLVGIGVPAAFFLLKKAPIKNEELASDAAHEERPNGHLEGSNDEEELEEDEEALGAIIPFDTFVVNIAGGRFVRLQMQIEFATLDVPKKFYSRIVPMRDAIITLLTESSAEDLQIQKGKDVLKGRIRTMMNEILRREEVRRIYFTQFVIQ